MKGKLCDGNKELGLLFFLFFFFSWITMAKNGWIKWDVFELLRLMMGRGCTPNPVMRQMSISVCYHTFCLGHMGFLPMHKGVSEGTVSALSPPSMQAGALAQGWGAVQGFWVLAIATKPSRNSGNCQDRNRLNCCLFFFTKWNTILEFIGKCDLRDTLVNGVY